MKSFSASIGVGIVTALLVAASVDAAPAPGQWTGKTGTGGFIRVGVNQGGTVVTSIRYRLSFLNEATVFGTFPITNGVFSFQDSNCPVTLIHGTFTSDSAAHGTIQQVGGINGCGAGSTLTPWSATPDAAPNDFNGDGRTDPGIVRPGAMPEALWYSPPSGGGAPFQILFGASGDIPVPGDYDGDGKADAVIFRPSTGLWIGPRTGAAQLIQLAFGQNGDIPVPCDYDGDGAVDPAIYQPSTGWWVGFRADGTRAILGTFLGLPGDIPVPADYDGDGGCEIAIMRPNAGPGGTSLWFAWGAELFQIYFGEAGDIPVPGDYDGDGRADAVIFRPSTGLWYGPRTGAAQIVIQQVVGQSGDIPIAGDYDGNGAIDPAVYRPGTGLFYGTNAAGDTVVLNTNLGMVPGDIPTGQRPYYQGLYPYNATSLQTGNARPSMSDRAGMIAGSAHAITPSTGSALARQGRSVVVAAATPASNNGFAAVIYLMIDLSTGATHCLVDDRWVAAEIDVPTQWTSHWELVTLAPTANADQLLPQSWATCRALLAGAILE